MSSSAPTRAVKAFQSTFNPLTNYLLPDFVERHPDAPYSTLWVTNLPSDATEDRVRALFSPLGLLVSVDVIVEANVQAQAHVCFRRWESGIKALCTLNNYFVQGRRIHVSTYIDDAATRRRPGGPSTIFINGLPPYMTTTRIFDHVRSFGLILSIRFMRRETAYHPKEARLEFLEERHAEAAIGYLNSYPINGLSISAGHWAVRQASRPTTPSTAPSIEQRPIQLYICPLDRHMTADALLTLFEHFGMDRRTIKGIEWPRNKKPGRSTHAFVEFHQAAHAKHAMHVMNRMPWNGRKLRVSYRRSRLETLWALPSAPSSDISSAISSNEQESPVVNEERAAPIPPHIPPPQPQPQHPANDPHPPNRAPPPPFVVHPFHWTPQMMRSHHPVLPWTVPAGGGLAGMNVNVASLVLRDLHVHPHVYAGGGHPIHIMRPPAPPPPYQ